MIQYVHNRRPNGLVVSKVNQVDREVTLVQGVHSRGGETIALDVIEPWFFDSLKVNDFFEKKAGYARCSNEDNYNKKTGRDLADSRMKLTRLVVSRIEDGYENDRFVILVDKDNNQYVLYKKGNNRVRFIDFIKG